MIYKNSFTIGRVYGLKTIEAERMNEIKRY